MSTPDFDLGDFIEELPYGGGSGSADEFISNSLIEKRLQLRNQEIKPGLLALGKKYIASSDSRYYISVSKRNSFEYSKDVKKLESKIKVLQAELAAKKAEEERRHIAKEKDPILVCSVRKMTATVADSIDNGFDLLNPEDSDEL